MAEVSCIPLKDSNPYKDQRSSAMPNAFPKLALVLIIIKILPLTTPYPKLKAVNIKPRYKKEINLIFPWT